MTTLTAIDAETLATHIAAGPVALIDIREPDEFARQHIAAARSIPLSESAHRLSMLEPDALVVFHCKSGMRTNANSTRLAAYVDRPAYMLDGGLDAWMRAGLSVVSDGRAPLELNRQVQIALGSFILLSTLLARFVDPAFILVSAGLGIGLLFAGITSWCGLARLLSVAPWNRRGPA